VVLCKKKHMTSATSLGDIRPALDCCWGTITLHLGSSWKQEKLMVCLFVYRINDV